MATDWLFWRAIVPLFGQPVLVLLYSVARWMAKGKWVGRENFARHGFSPLGYFLFSLISLVHLFIDLGSLEQSPPPAQIYFAAGLGIFLIVVHALAVDDKLEIDQPESPVDLRSIGRAYSAAIAATIINLASLHLFRDA